MRYNNFKPLYKENELRLIALEWLPYSPSNTPFGGGWHWHVCVDMEQEKLWNFVEFRQGRTYAHLATKPDRDTNPYTERSRHRSWDCGYVWGLSERD